MKFILAFYLLLMFARAVNAPKMQGKPYVRMPTDTVLAFLDFVVVAAIVQRAWGAP